MAEAASTSKKRKHPSNIIFVMATAFTSIMLLIVARHQPPSWRKIQQIWDERVHGESNTTMLRSSPEKVLVETTTAIPSESTNSDIHCHPGGLPVGLYLGAIFGCSVILLTQL
jgi:hypothetical protein